MKCPLCEMYSTQEDWENDKKKFNDIKARVKQFKENKLEIKRKEEDEKEKRDEDNQSR